MQKELIRLRKLVKKQEEDLLKHKSEKQNENRVVHNYDLGNFTQRFSIPRGSIEPLETNKDQKMTATIHNSQAQRDRIRILKELEEDKKFQKENIECDNLTFKDDDSEGKYHQKQYSGTQIMLESNSTAKDYSNSNKVPNSFTTNGPRLSMISLDASQTNENSSRKWEIFSLDEHGKEPSQILQRQKDKWVPSRLRRIDPNTFEIQRC